MEMFSIEVPASDLDMVFRGRSNWDDLFRVSMLVQFFPADMVILYDTNKEPKKKKSHCE